MITDSFNTTELLTNIGLSMLHSLWLVTLIAIVAMLIIRYVSLSAAARHRIAMTAQLISLFAVILVFLQFSSGSTEKHTLVSVIENPADEKQLTTDLTGPGQTLSLFTYQRYFSSAFLGICWLVGVILMMSYKLVIYYMSKRMKNNGLLPVTDYWSAKLQQLADKTGLSRRIGFHVSEKVNSPLMIGFFKPVILVPLGFFGELSPAEIESILLHELAHIRRNDYLSMIVQHAVNMLLFYHPAIWLLSKIIDREREHACDDHVLSITGDAATYARALGTMQLNYSKTQNKMAMNLLNNKNAVINRLKRLIGEDTAGQHQSAKLLVLPAIVILSGILLAFAPADKPAAPLSDPYYPQLPMVASDTGIVKYKEKNDKTRDKNKDEVKFKSDKKESKQKAKYNFEKKDAKGKVKYKEKSSYQYEFEDEVEEIVEEEHRLQGAVSILKDRETEIEGDIEVIVEEVPEIIEEEIANVNERIAIIEEQIDEEVIEIEVADTIPADLALEYALLKRQVSELRQQVAALKAQKGEEVRENKLIREQKINEVRLKAALEREEAVIKVAKLREQAAHERRAAMRSEERARAMSGRVERNRIIKRVTYEQMFEALNADGLAIAKGEKIILKIEGGDVYLDGAKLSSKLSARYRKLLKGYIDEDNVTEIELTPGRTQIKSENKN